MQVRSLHRHVNIALALALALALCIQVASAQEEAPTPSRLELDWWHYVSAAEEERDERLDRLAAQLRQVQASAESTVRGQAQDALLALKRYRKGARAYDGEELELPTAMEQYRLTDIYALADRVRALQRNLSIAKLEVERLEELESRLQTSLDLLRGQYRKLSPTGADRLRIGLELMTRRFQVERVGQQLTAGQDQLRLLLEALQHSEILLEASFEKLAVTNDDLLRLLESGQEIAQQLNRNEPLSLQVEFESSHGGARSTQVQQMGLQVGRVHNVLRREVNATEAALVGYLLQEPDHSPDTVRERLSLLREASRQIQLNIARWEEFLAHEALTQDRSGSSTGQEAKRKMLQSVQQRMTELQNDLNRSQLLEQIAAAQLVLREGWVGHAGKWLIGEIADAWDAAQDWTAYSLFEIEGTPVTPAGILRLLLILFIAWWLSLFIQAGLRRLGDRTNSVNQASIYALRRILHYCMLFLGLLIGLSSIGVDFAKFALLVSALGIGIGFGLQSFVQNFFAGLTLMFERSLKVGDFVQLESGVVGEVREINMRATHITTNENVDVLVPNSEFVNSRVTNWTLMDEYVRIKIPFGVAYGTDKEVVKKAALRAAEIVPYTRHDQGFEPRVLMTGFGDNALEFALVVGIRSDVVRTPALVESAYFWELENQLREAGIEIPFPQRDLHLRSDKIGFDMEAFSGPAGKSLLRAG